MAIDSSVNPTPTRLPWAQYLAGGILLGLLASSLPGYLRGGQWSWQQPPAVTELRKLREIRETGVAVAGWSTTDQATFKLGGHKWSKQLLVQAKPGAVAQAVSQAVSQDSGSALLFLRAQHDPKTQPEVEWADFRGLNRWTEDEERSVTIRPGVKARLVRGWTRDRTEAILQWYAWPGGGSPTPIDWFVGDRQAQIQGDRLPWIAVSILLPMEPLGDLAKVEEQAKALGGEVQTAIEARLAGGNALPETAGRKKAPVPKPTPNPDQPSAAQSDAGAGTR
jgi:cyanoexosortase B-associated protein